MTISNHVRSYVALFAVIFALFVLTNVAQTEANQYNLPAGAKLIETQIITSTPHANRALILWMINPKRNPRNATEPYTCPDETRGSYYSGPTRVSLVDTDTKKIINTLSVKEEDEDSFDIPYLIHESGYYSKRANPKAKESKPFLITLNDYNGDGKAAEFALFDAVACMGLQTALFGYSESKDQVIQYETHLKVSDGKKTSTQVLRWVDYLFGQKAVKPGFWQYEIDYRGRGGTLDKYEIRYNPKQERFEGTLTSKTDD